MNQNSITPDTQDAWYKISYKLLQEAGVKINGDRPWDIQVKNNKFYKRVLQQGSLGLGESYMDGWWECERPDEFIRRLLEADLESVMTKRFKDLVRVAGARLINLQSKKRAWIVGKEHYDLGNDLFTRMLDPWMQYSCGYWRHATDLFTAQQDKLRLICEKLQLKEGMTLLDIGCGWGGLAAFAAENYGVKVTGITISAEQQKLAQQRCEKLDVTILLQDYRDLEMQFDRIVSVGMFEHVGPKNYATYFEVVNKNLKPNGLFLLHTIGSNQTDINVDPWINKYIFPNGCLPSVAHIATASEPWFVIEDLHNFGPDYDRTLMAWYERFLATWPEIDSNYSTRFKRMFTYYLNACAGAFRARNIQLWQLVLTRGVNGGLQVPR
ncbi:MAG: cyclopropane fatty acyl phospholipid synthase [Yokenella regensburgei]|jgi:cyclopropane-fatty-acyl-phospholipid synthase|uniref:Cyclopropane-fatty-acyl-phospholipid synthase n=1 Tax=Yokenella regensburgei TaxID=158877 RepID=A0AB38FYC2_9ENTR|nr:cyclopropane fatty acyl phospholipid synthase [Yokenella regensburgei]KAF1368008.1 cyclopropane-fatty-acyl-phospholipid synthase [Yokenella regensburgei]KFD22175.1 cyclopropane-fatty-acyl-phospholipid synthase [Yokenella regensburgei ATCC 49455]MDR3103312.1 cyclopropane fatty acyl phospholipid synthase [Yokenella regensburgei]QIU89687.1 cyclopropane fatty acyl phospholipid synthase [Yokenella regensburgei]RKR63714.1 cyclopropane-fatty-acyl-phospholipid synthase [Yokenella regensburgei]